MIFYFIFIEISSLEISTTDTFLRLPNNFTIGTDGYEIITAQGGAGWILEFLIRNFEPERLICFDSILEIRNHGENRVPLLWGICTKQLVKKKIYSCGAAVEYKQHVVLESERMTVAVRAVLDDSSLIKPYLCQKSKLNEYVELGLIFNRKRILTKLVDMGVKHLFLFHVTCIGTRISTICAKARLQ